MLEALRSDDERMQGHAVSNLSLLVERALIPALAKQNSDLLKQLNLLDLDLSMQGAAIDKDAKVILNIFSR